MSQTVMVEYCLVCLMSLKLLLQQNYGPYGICNATYYSDHVFDSQE